MVKVKQPSGSVDRDEALKILKQRPYVANVAEKLKYCGVTALYHVFSYPIG
jgi:predicted rRNA methylase YqxC with S4 and FtsJ domains